jgi:hypothetical protein
VLSEHADEERRERDAAAAVVLGRAVDQLATDLGGTTSPSRPARWARCCTWAWLRYGCLPFTMRGNFTPSAGLRLRRPSRIAYFSIMLMTRW